MELRSRKIVGDANETPVKTPAKKMRTPKVATKDSMAAKRYADIEEQQLKVSNIGSKTDDNDDALNCDNCAMGDLSKMSRKDRASMILLLLLYTLQGIPMGLSASIPLIFKERGVGYESLSLFSLVSTPFSLKLLWAPFVDTYYVKSFGRRKSWLVPIQILTGLFMIFVGAGNINEWMGESTNDQPNVLILTIFFTALYLLMATQDIAVDGWAISMLSRENVGYASICNTIGQTLGVFLSFQGFIALSDPHWCHQWLNTGEGVTILNLAGFMQFWGYIFIITTIIIVIFKKEDLEFAEGEHPEGIIETSQHVISILKLKPIQMLCMILFTQKISFAAIDSIFSFKLQVKQF